MKLPSNTVEITKEAAWVLIGNDESTWKHYTKYDQFEISIYESNGVKIFARFDFELSVIQYYIQDINA